MTDEAAPFKTDPSRTGAFECIARGAYLEGLCVNGDTLWVSDPVAGGIQQMGPSGAIATLLPEKRWIGGLLQHEDGSLLISGEGGITWLNPATGATGRLDDKCDDQSIAGVNEMVADDDGGIYFGSVDVPAIMRGQPPAAAAIYHLAADGRLRQVCGGLRFTNGLALSPDGTRLYHCETFAGVSAYPIAPDGTLGPATRLLRKADCDGLTVDAEGTLWITGCMSPAITRLRPDGTLKELVDTPGGGVTAVRFGGADGRDLYVNTVAAGVAEQLKAGGALSAQSSVLYRTRATVPGLPLRPARVPLPTN